MTFTTAVRRFAVVGTGALALTLGLAFPAAAHVTIQPGTATQGGWTKIAFRVPNERDNASTSKIEVEFPTDHPLPFVSVKPVPGWDVKVTRGELPAPVVNDDGDTVTEAVLKITWSGGKINPGEFQEFEASLGPLPKSVDKLQFPTAQTYTNGEVVKWADEPKDDGSEAEHPVPVLKLTAPADGEGGNGAASASPSATPVAADAESSAAEDASDGTARLLAGIGIAVGVAGAAIGVAGMRRSRN